HLEGYELLSNAGASTGRIDVRAAERSRQYQPAEEVTVDSVKNPYRRTERESDAAKAVKPEHTRRERRTFERLPVDGRFGGERRLDPADHVRRCCFRNFRALRLRR